MLNTPDIITIFLSSSVLVGIISAIVTFIINRKNNNLKYITEDRRKWRDEIKSIVDALENENSNKNRKILEKLKVRINPYGKTDNDFLHDYHIWETIQKMENAKNHKEYHEQKKILIYYLSLLLKYDWERTKKEVVGNTKLFLFLSIVLISFGYLIYKHFVEYNFEYNDTFLCAIIVFILVPIILGQGTLQLFFSSIWKKKKETSIKKYFNRFIFVIIPSFILIAYFIILSLFVLISYNFNIWNCISGKGYLEVTLVIALIILIYKTSQSLTAKNITTQYVSAIEKEYYAEQNSNQPV